MSDILEMRRIIHLHGSAHFTIPLRLLDEPNVAVSVLTKLTPQSFNKRTKNIFTDLIRDLNIFILKSQKRDTYSRTLKRFFRITFPRLSLKIKQKNQHFHKSCWSTRCKNLPLPQYTFFYCLNLVSPIRIVKALLDFLTKIVEACFSSHNLGCMSSGKFISPSVPRLS